MPESATEQSRVKPAAAYSALRLCGAVEAAAPASEQFSENPADPFRPDRRISF